MTSEFISNPNRTCAFTGHRVIGKNFDKNNLIDKITKLIEIGYDTFLVGMAIGFDTLVFNELEKIRLNKPIKIIACVPCLNQSLKFTVKQKTEYDRMLKSADYVVYTGKNYTEKCMQKRNEFMIDNSSCIISYVRRDYGGSVKTVKYAIKKGVINIGI